MFVFAGLLYLVAVAAACALPKELANSTPSHEDDDDDYTPLNEASNTNNGEASESTVESSGSYGSV